MHQCYIPHLILVVVGSYWFLKVLPYLGSCSGTEGAGWEMLDEYEAHCHVAWNSNVIAMIWSEAQFPAGYVWVTTTGEGLLLDLIKYFGRPSFSCTKCWPSFYQTSAKHLPKSLLQPASQATHVLDENASLCFFINILHNRITWLCL